MIAESATFEHALELQNPYEPDDIVRCKTGFLLLSHIII